MSALLESLLGRGKSLLRISALVPLVACGAPAADTVAQAPAPPSGQSAPSYIYACVQDEARIAIIDADRLEVVRSVDLTALGFSPTANPHHIAVEPDGEAWYVSLIGENRVARFDREGGLQGTFEMSTPGMLSFEPGSGVLLASRSMSAVNPPTRVGWVDTRTMEGDEIDVFLSRPHPMVVTPDGRWAYTGSLGVNQIAAIELETEEVSLVNLDGPPHALVQFAVSADGRWLVAATELSGRLLVFDLSDPAQPRQIASLEIGPMAFDPAFSPDGAAVWVPVKGANEVAVVRTSDWTVERRIQSESFLQPHQVLFAPDGTRAFVSSNNKADHMAGMTMPGHGDHAAHDMPATEGAGNVTVVDMRTFEVIGVLELGRNVTGMGTASGAVGP
jgi:DNA-binding beta-propeller fold protein YncE